MNGSNEVLHCIDATVSPIEFATAITTIPTGSLKVKLSDLERVLIWASIIGVKVLPRMDPESSSFPRVISTSETTI